MRPIGARMGQREPVGEGAAGTDVRGRRRRAVHVVAQGDAVPVHRRGPCEAIVHGDRQLVADVGPNQRAGNAVAVGEGARQSAAQVDGGRLRRQRCRDSASGMRPGRFGRGDRCGARCRGRRSRRAAAGCQREPAGDRRREECSPVQLSALKRCRHNRPPVEGVVASTCQRRLSNSAERLRYSSALMSPRANRSSRIMRAW